MLLFSASLSISFFFESCSSNESSHFWSFPWLRLCFFLCIQSSFLLQSRLCQFLRQYHFRMIRRCPRSFWVVELFASAFSSPVLLKSSFASFFVVIVFFVSRSSCICFSFVWWVEAFCVASTESFSRALLCGTMFLMRSSVVGVTTASNSRSRWLSRYFFEVSSCLHLWTVVQAVLIRFLISVISCCWKSNHLAQVFCAFSSCHYLNFYVIHLNFFSDVRALIAENCRLSWMDPETPLFQYSSWIRITFFGAVLLMLQTGARRQ